MDWAAQPQGLLAECGLPSRAPLPALLPWSLGQHVCRGPRSLTPVLLCPASERWVVDVDRVVRLQRQLWARLAEKEQELHQPGASQRGRLL